MNANFADVIKNESLWKKQRGQEMPNEDKTVINEKEWAFPNF